MRATRTIDHPESWALLPWLANGTLEGGELEGLLEHLKACRVCREELRFLPELRLSADAAPAPAWAPAPPPRLWARIEAYEREREGRRGASWRRWLERLAPLPEGLRRLALAQGVLLLVLALALVRAWAPAPGPAFRTLARGAPPAAVQAAPELGVVFAEGTLERELREALAAARAEIAAGPSAAGVYTLRLLVGASMDAALAELRARPFVALAEPVHGGG